MKVAVFAALPHELTHIIAGICAVERGERDGVKVSEGLFGMNEVIVFETGVGRSNAENGYHYARKTYSFDAAVAVGFCGALYADILPGELVLAERVSKLAEGDAVEIHGAADMVSRMVTAVDIELADIVTLGKWISKKAVREAVPRQESITVCDMETYPFARLAYDDGVPFYAIRGVTDAHDREVLLRPDMVTDATGRYSQGRTVWHLLSRPWLIPNAVRLGKGSSAVSRNLWLALRALLENL